MIWLLYLFALFTVATTFLLTYRADVRRAVPVPALTAGLRALILALVWLLLISPAITTSKQETQKPVIVFLQDASLSAGAALGTDSASYRIQAGELIKNLDKDYRVATYGFGSRGAACR